MWKQDLFATDLKKTVEQVPSVVYFDQLVGVAAPESWFKSFWGAVFRLFSSFPPFFIFFPVKIRFASTCLNTCLEGEATWIHLTLGYRDRLLSSSSKTKDGTPTCQPLEEGKVVFFLVLILRTYNA